MADNTVLNVGVGGDSVRDIDRGGGVKTQVVQLDIGGAAAEKLLSPGQATKANSLPMAIASDDDIQAKLGIVTETAPASDTASSGLNGRLQRVAQRLTSLIALLPTALGQLTKANSLSVTLASDQGALTTADSKLPAALGSALSAASLPVVIASDQALWPATQPVSGTVTVGNASLPVVQQIGGTSIGNANPMPILDAYVAPVVVNWTTATTVNTASTVNVAGFDLVVVSLVGSALAGGQLVFEVFDGAAWFPVKSSDISSYATTPGPALSGTMNKAYEVPVAGFPSFRVRLSTALTGGTLALGLIVSSAPDVSVVTVGMDPAAPLPAGANLIGGVDTVVKFTANTPPANTITTGGTTQTLFAANANRRGFAVQNQSSGNLYIGNTPATLDQNRLLIAPGAYYETPPTHSGTAQIDIIGATTGQQFWAREWQ